MFFCLILRFESFERPKPKTMVLFSSTKIDVLVLIVTLSSNFLLTSKTLCTMKYYSVWKKKYQNSYPHPMLGDGLNFITCLFPTFATKNHSQKIKDPPNEIQNPTWKDIHVDLNLKKKSLTKKKNNRKW